MLRIRHGYGLNCSSAETTSAQGNLSTKIILNVVFITLGEPQAHGDTAEPVPFRSLIPFAFLTGLDLSVLLVGKNSIWTGLTLSCLNV